MTKLGYSYEMNHLNYLNLPWCPRQGGGQDATKPKPQPAVLESQRRRGSELSARRVHPHGQRLCKAQTRRSCVKCLAASR